MERKLGKAIAAARRATRLTQKELGERLGVHAQTIRRWEWEDTLPNRRKCAALVAAISAVNPGAARKLAQVLGADLTDAAKNVEVARAPASTSSVTSTSAPPALDLAIFQMSDDLNASPPRVRRSVLEFLKRLRAENLSIEIVEQQLEERVGSSPLD